MDGNLNPSFFYVLGDCMAKKQINKLVLKDKLETLRKEVNDRIDSIISYIDEYLRN
jgi:hypothetical protein